MPFALWSAPQGLALGSLALALGSVSPYVALAQTASLVVDDSAQVHSFATPAKRIVSLLPSVTETICALQACGRLVGVDRYSNWPEAVLDLPQVGGLSDANIEAIVALQPDLVIMRSRNRAMARLQELGFRVMALDANQHSDARRHMELIARALGQPGQGEALWRQLELRIERLKNQIPPAWRGRSVYLELHSGTAAAGQHSFMGELLTQLGFVNVVPAHLGMYPKMSPEFVVRVNPDLLITVDSAAVRPPHLRAGWGPLNAVKNKHVCALSGQAYDVLMRAGPRLDWAAQEMLDCLQALDAAGLSFAPFESLPARVTQPELVLD